MFRGVYIAVVASAAAAERAVAVAVAVALAIVPVAEYAAETLRPVHPGSRVLRLIAITQFNLLLQPRYY